MDDAAIIGAQRAGQWRFVETMLGAPKTHLHREPGLLALITPDAPYASFFNGVVYDDPQAVIGALPQLDALYAEAGVRAWTVWVHHDDPQTAEACAAAGHTLDATPALMGAEIADLDLDSPSDAPLDHAPDWLTLGNLNAIAYSGPSGLGQVAAGMTTDNYVRVLARVGGAPRACAAGLLHDGNCEVVFVATDPAGRRQGLARHCTTAVLRAAAAAGATTTTLEATKLGEPVYARMGYRSVGRLAMWERRRA